MTSTALLPRYRKGQTIKAPGSLRFLVTRTAGDTVWMTCNGISGQSHRTTQAELARIGYRVVAA